MARVTFNIDPPELKRRNGKYVWQDSGYDPEPVTIKKTAFPGRVDMPLRAVWYVTSEGGSTIDKLDAPPRGHPHRKKYAATIKDMEGSRNPQLSGLLLMTSWA